MFLRSLWKTETPVVSSSEEDVPTPPPAPTNKTPMADTAMNCIRHYIVNRNRRIRELVVYLKSHIEQELADQSLVFGKSEVDMNLETIVMTSDAFADDFGGHNNIVDAEWNAISQEELSEYFLALGLKYKAHDDNVHISITIPPRPNGDAASSECPELLSKLWKNLVTYAEKREHNITSYCNDLVTYVFDKICHVARTRGDNDIIIDLEDAHKHMPKWENAWNDAHGLTHTEQKRITTHLSDVMISEGFDVQDFPWKFKMSFTWSAPSCIWRYSDNDGGWKKM